MWNPFKSLIDKIMDGLEESFADNDFVPRAQAQNAGTKFEQELEKRFYDSRHKPGYGTLMVSIGDERNDYAYKDPYSSQQVRGHYIISSLSHAYRPEDIVEKENGIGRMVVMLLDLNGPPLEQQIPGWKKGTMEFPDRFLTEGAVITVASDALYSCRGAGLIVDERKVMNRIAPMQQSRYAYAVESAQPVYRDLPDFKPAFVRGAAGNPVLAPSHIRGVLNNDSGSQEPQPGL